jgi:endonuclease III
MTARPVIAAKTIAHKTRGGTRGRCRRRRKGSPWPLERRRPGLLGFVLAGLREMYGVPEWTRRREPTEELVVTILAQHTSDLNAERAFGELRRRLPTWSAVEAASLPELEAAIASGGLARQKAPRIQAALRAIRAERGDYSLEFLAAMPPLAARDWLTRIPGVGKKTASVVLLFCFGMPLMPVDTHVHRVTRRIGLVPPRASPDEAHERLMADIPPESIFQAHVNLITHGRQTCHARNPACFRCAVAARCRYLDPQAP